MNNKFHQDEIKIINSQIFYRNINDDVIFINSIDNLSIEFDKKNFNSTLNSNNKIFNIPYSFNVNQDSSNKTSISEFNFKPLKLKINNEMNKREKNLTGILDLSYLNKNYSLKYEKNENSFIFNQIDRLGKKIEFNFGVLNIKPFYLNYVLTLKSLDIKNLLSENSLFQELLKSQILNNSNLNLEIRANIDSFKQLNNFENIFLKFQIQEGVINTNSSKVLWDKNLEIEFEENYIFIEEGIVRLNGTINLTVFDYKKFYSTFQTSKEQRKKFKKIKFNFNYNFLTNKLKIDNFYLDEKYSESINKYLNDTNKEDNDIRNWIDFKRYINEIAFSYSG